MNLINENEFTSFKHNNELITYEIYKNIYNIINDKITNKKVIKLSINQNIKIKKLEELENKRIDEQNKLNMMIIQQMDEKF